MNIKSLIIWQLPRQYFANPPKIKGKQQQIIISV